MVINANELMKSRVFFFVFFVSLDSDLRASMSSACALNCSSKEGGKGGWGVKRRGEWCERRYCENLKLYYQTLAAHHMELFNQKEELQYVLLEKNFFYFILFFQNQISNE